MNRTLAVSFLAALVCSTTAACAVQRAEDDPEAASSSVAAALSAADGTRVLELVNYPGTDLHVLDEAVGLDARAARAIVAARDGADGVTPSADDVSFASIAALDAVPYVGDAAFTKLAAYAAAHPAPQGETVEGVTFTGWQSLAITWSVDHAELAQLDALLDARAAKALFDHRPYADVTEMGPQSYVGPSALTALQHAAPTFWAAMHSSAPSLAGTFDGVAFDEKTAAATLAIANGATVAQLEINDVSAAAAATIVAQRPYAGLGAVAALGGVGPATMRALQAYAATGAFGAAPDFCTSSFDGAVRAHLADVLFLSESDRDVEIVSFPGASAKPTVDVVLGLTGSPSSSTTYVRPVGDYFTALEPSSGAADPGAAAAIQAAFSQLHDVTYVAVILPGDRAVVHVYLVGRTACGDVVGLTSIAIET